MRPDEKKRRDRLRGRGVSDRESAARASAASTGTREGAERELERSLALLQSTLDATADGILVVDHHGAIVTYNRQFTEMWRLPESVLAARDDQRALASAVGQLKDPEGFLNKVRELYA